MTKLNDEQKKRLSAYLKTEEGGRDAVQFFVCATFGVILVSVGVGFMFGAEYGLLLAGAVLLLNATSIILRIKKGLQADERRPELQAARKLNGRPSNEVDRKEDSRCRQ